MATTRVCRKCGGQRRRWPRGCARCRNRAEEAENAADVGELAAEVGVFGWIARGLVASARFVVRLLN